MLWVVLTVVVILTVSVVIIAAVALPHLREGSQLLTPRGEQVVREARARLTNTRTRDQGI